MALSPTPYMLLVSIHTRRRQPAPKPRNEFFDTPQMELILY